MSGPPVHGRGRCDPATQDSHQSATVMVSPSRRGASVAARRLALAIAEADAAWHREHALPLLRVLGLGGETP